MQTTKYWLNYWKISFFLLLREISIAHAHSPNTILNISRGIKHFLDFLHNCLCNKVISALFLHMHSASADYGRCRTQNKSQFHEIFTTADGRTLCLHTIVWKEGHSLRNWCFDLIERMKKRATKCKLFNSHSFSPIFKRGTWCKTFELNKMLVLKWIPTQIL